MNVNFRARIAKQGDNRIIIVPNEYLDDVKAFKDDLLDITLAKVEGAKYK